MEAETEEHTLPSDQQLRTEDEKKQQLVNSLEAWLLSKRVMEADSPFWKLPVARPMGAWTWSPVSAERARSRATPPAEEGKDTDGEDRGQEDRPHPSLHPPAAASGEKMSMPPPSARRTTHPLSICQKSLCWGASRASSERRQPGKAESPLQRSFPSLALTVANTDRGGGGPPASPQAPADPVAELSAQTWSSGPGSIGWTPYRCGHTELQPRQLSGR